MNILLDKNRQKEFMATKPDQLVYKQCFNIKRMIEKQPRVYRKQRKNSRIVEQYLKKIPQNQQNEIIDNFNKNSVY